MICMAMLFWVGLKLTAPVWYWVLWGIWAFIKAFQLFCAGWKASSEINE